MRKHVAIRTLAGTLALALAVGGLPLPALAEPAEEPAEAALLSEEAAPEGALSATGETAQTAPEPTPAPAPSAEPLAEEATLEQADAPAPAATKDPYAPVTEFVTQLYKTCLLREPDAPGLKNWVDRLKGGGMSGAQAAYGFIFSPEFKANNYCNTDFVRQLYLAFMGREADAAGLANWVNALDTGTMREEVFNGFATSAEFGVFCRAHGIARGSAVTLPTHGTYTSGPCKVCGAEDALVHFVRQLYTAALDREPDAAGLEDWITKLRSGKGTGRQVAAGVILSSEFAAHNYSDTEFLQRLYRAMFGREISYPDLQGWLSYMNRGPRPWRVFGRVADSVEFGNVCARYGIARG